MLVVLAIIFVALFVLVRVLPSQHQPYAGMSAQDDFAERLAQLRDML